MKKKVKLPRETKAALALIVFIHLKSKYLTGNFVDKNSSISMFKYVCFLSFVSSTHQ